MSEKKISFGKIFWPSFLAVFIMSVIGLLIFALILGGVIGRFGEFGPKPLAVKNNTVLHMTLDGQINEKSSVELDASSLSLNDNIGLSDVLFGIELAKTDSKIKGIFLEIGDLSCGYATAREIRNALNDFETSGKFIVAYNSGEVITQKEYYIASAANEVYGFPSSMMEFVGLGYELTFYKNTLDKLEVEVQVVRGKNNDFKSAVEPFFREYMSDSSRLQMTRYISSIWEDVREEIAKDRKVKPARLNEIADSLLIRRASDAISHHLLDGVKYRDEIIALINQKIGNEVDEKINFQDFQKYAKKKFYKNQAITKGSDPTIAVILAEGEVSKDGDGLTSNDICELLIEARKNTSIKTIVLRINSPGGSALASEEIWREVSITNKTKKVVVSMGDVAASGGYYIATPASYIFAEPSTITGSIGVFGMIPFTGKMLENKLGLTFDRVATNKFSVMSMNRKMTKEEFEIVQEEVDTIYGTFLNRVATGRKMKLEKVNQIARGRVWTGKDAKEIGLIDELGGLKKAIAYAAKQAGIKEPIVLYYPLRKEDKWLDLFEQFEEENNASVKSSTVKIPTELLNYYNELKAIENKMGIQARLPFEITIK